MKSHSNDLFSYNLQSKIPSYNSIQRVSPMNYVYRYIPCSIGAFHLSIALFIVFNTGGITNRLSPSVYYRELKKNYCKCHCHCLLTDRIIDGLFDGYMSNSPKEIQMNKKSSMKWYTVFLSVKYYIHRWKYQQNKAGKTFFLACLFV